MQKTFDFISDPGHGWVKVHRAILSDLMIADKISRYSYQRGAFAYLEEDCDLTIFFNAYRDRFGTDPKIRERVARERRSRIRGYDKYQYYPLPKNFRIYIPGLIPLNRGEI